MAVSAAVASGVRLPSGRDVAKAAPQAVAVSDRLVEMLKHCNVISIATSIGIDRPVTHEIEYIHVPGSKKHEHTREIDGYTKNMRPISFLFREAAGDVARLTVVWA